MATQLDDQTNSKHGDIKRSRDGSIQTSTDMNPFVKIQDIDIPVNFNQTTRKIFETPNWQKRITRHIFIQNGKHFASPYAQIYPVTEIGASLATRWEKWLAGFEMYSTASGITNDTRKSAFLLYQVD
eukprot:gene2565-758_t